MMTIKNLQLLAGESCQENGRFGRRQLYYSWWALVM